MTDLTTEQKEQLWSEFLKRWPLATLETMTLEQYTATGTDDSFTYWLESRTDQMGSIWGGSAFKFGVYSRKDTTEKESNNKRAYTTDYGWLNKYGDSPQGAFKAVMQEIVKTAQAARAGDLDTVDAVDLGEAMRWKIAFMYQDREHPCIAPIFKGEYLRSLLDDPLKSLPEGHRELMDARSSESLFEYGTQLWQRIESTLDKPLTTEQALRYLQQTDTLRTIKPPTKYLGGFESEDGLQLALSIDTKKVTLYLSPGEWQKSAAQYFNSPVTYDEDSPRNSNLAANAPTLALGRPCIKVAITRLNDLIQLSETYTGQENKSTQTVKGTNMSKTSTSTTAPLNQILYGPPGTGKTYETTRLAVAIADPKWMAETFEALHSDPKQQRSMLKSRYLELVKDEHICFTTFHQSFSYEDFVEGIRPATDDDSDKMNYEVKAGIFRKIAAEADKTISRDTGLKLSNSPTLWKISIGRPGQEHMRKRCLDANEARIGWNQTGDLSVDFDDRNEAEQAYWDTIKPRTRGTILNFSEKVKIGDVLLCFKNQETIQAIGIVESDYYFDTSEEARDEDIYAQVRKVNWILRGIDLNILSLNHGRNLTRSTLYPLSRFNWEDLVKELKKQSIPFPLNSQPVEKPKKKDNFVLIIDEINRGNTSRIFGELITLLEDDKRKGATDEKSVTLPYSKEPFSVPSNLYIIGTMNTADKSLAQMDLALRRRFSFVETPPQPELLHGTVVHGVDMADMLRSINQRIEVLLDAEHTIGHAYFMPLLNLSNAAEQEALLALIFKDKILPLLQEYFFDDYQRIGWVLNCPNSDRQRQFIQQQTSPALDSLFGSAIAEQLNDNRYCINQNAFTQAEAYQGIVA